MQVEVVEWGCGCGGGDGDTDVIVEEFMKPRRLMADDGLDS